MVPSDTDTEVAAAVEAGRWNDTLRLLSTRRAERELSADELVALGDAGWWTGSMEVCIDNRERAFASLRASGRHREAAKVAILLARDYAGTNRSSVRSGAWLAEAERMLENDGDSFEAGFLLREKAARLNAEGRLQEARAMVDEALEMARRIRDDDLEALAVQELGRMLVQSGQLDEGLPLLDRAMLAGITGALDPLVTGIVFCNVITSCLDFSDLTRAAEWNDAAKRWCDQQAIAGFPGVCRVRRAEVTKLRGFWAEAEREIRKACEELDRHYVTQSAHGFYELGMIRFRLGDDAGADEAFQRAHSLGFIPQPGLALLNLRRGRREEAAASIRRSVETRSGNLLTRLRILPGAVEVLLANGDIEDAASAASELEDLAGIYRTDVIRASADTWKGAVALARGNQDEAMERLSAAVDGWSRVEAPYEEGEARELLAEALELAGDLPRARLERSVAADLALRLGIASIRWSGPTRTDEGDAEQVALVFTDIVDSTPLVEAMGDDAWLRLLAWHDQTVRMALAEHGGVEANHTGDGFFLAFDEPSAAIAFAVDLDRRFTQHRDRHGFAPRIRIGAHFDQATRRGDGYFGRGVHVAARVASAADADEVLVSVALAEAAGIETTAPPRSLELKGLGEAVEVVAVNWR